MAFTANSSDNASHSVQVYSDISGGTRNAFPEPVVTPQLRYRVDIGGSIAENSIGLDV